MAKGLNELALGYAGAGISAALMVLLSIGAKLGVYVGATAQMMDWHMFYSLTVGGVIAGIVEAALWGFVFAYAFGWIYNKYA